MPRDELAAFDRAVPQPRAPDDLGRVGDDARRRRRSAAARLVNWMTSIDVPADVRAEWAREHGVDGVDGAEWDDDVGPRSRASSASRRPSSCRRRTRRSSAGPPVWAGRRRRPGATPPTAATAAAARSAAVRGTKQSGLRAHLATAVAAGARLVDGAAVTSVLVDGGQGLGVVAEVAPTATARGGEAAAPPGRPGAAGRPRRRGAPHADDPRGVGSDPPGDRPALRIHPVPVIAGHFDEPIDMWRGTMQAARSLEFNQDDDEHRRLRDRVGAGPSRA